MITYDTWLGDESSPGRKPIGWYRFTMPDPSPEMFTYSGLPHMQWDVYRAGKRLACLPWQTTPEIRARIEAFIRDSCAAGELLSDQIEAFVATLDLAPKPPEPERPPLVIASWADHLAWLAETFPGRFTAAGVLSAARNGWNAPPGHAVTSDPQATMRLGQAYAEQAGINHGGRRLVAEGKPHGTRNWSVTDGS